MSKNTTTTVSLLNCNSHIRYRYSWEKDYVYGQFCLPIPYQVSGTLEWKTKLGNVVVMSLCKWRQHFGQSMPWTSYRHNHNLHNVILNKVMSSYNVALTWDTEVSYSSEVKDVAGPNFSTLPYQSFRHVWYQLLQKSARKNRYWLSSTKLNPAMLPSSL